MLRSVANLTRARRRGVPGAGAAGAGPHRGRGPPARGGERGARAPAGGRGARRGGAGAVRGGLRGLGEPHAPRASARLLARGGSRERASATARQTLGCTAMPQWLVRTSTSSSAAGSRQARQSTTPSLFEYTETKPTPRGQRAGAGAPRSPAAVALQAARLEEPRRSQRPAAGHGRDLGAHQRVHGERVRLRGSERDDAGDQLGPARGQHLARGRRRGSGRRSPRAALLAHELLEPLLEALDRGPGAVDVGQHPGPLGRWPVRRSQLAISASEPSPAMKPGISSTGWPRPSLTPAPRRTGSRRSAAVSSPIRASRQSGGRGPPVMGIRPLTAEPP